MITAENGMLMNTKSLKKRQMMLRKTKIQMINQQLKESY